MLETAFGRDLPAYVLACQRTGAIHFLRAGTQRNLHIVLATVTSLPSAPSKHRLRLPAGNRWELRDVSAA